MKNKTVCLFFMMLFPLISMAQNTRFTEAGYSFINFNADLLNNRTNINNKPGYAVFIASQGKFHRYFNAGSKFSVGKLLNLGEPFKQYSSGNFIRLDLELIFNINNLFFKDETVLVMQTFVGYGFSYIPAHKQAGFKEVSSNITYGISGKYFLKSSAGLSMNININQRIGADFRTFLRFEPGVVFRF